VARAACVTLARVLRSDGAPRLARVLPALAAALAAALVRLPPCSGDLWLDEVWTAMAARELGSPLEILTGFRTSNNHPLNTLFVYLAGAGTASLPYRLHSLAAGVAAVLLAGAIARRWGALEARFAVLLTGLSYLLIHYSSEARGYSLLVCFAFSSWLAALRFCERPGWGRAAALWLCIALGFLSHLTFLYAFLAILAGSALALRASGGSRARGARAFARGFGAPVAALGAWWGLALRQLVIGAADPYQLGEVLASTLSLAAGGPAAGPAAQVASLACAALLALAIARAWRRSPAEGLAFAIAIFLAPAAVLALLRPDVLAVQYFLVDVAFGLLALAGLLAAGWRRGGAARLGVALALALFAAGNAAHIARLYRFGRGGYHAGMLRMAERTPGPVLSVTSDHDDRNGMLLRFYEERLPAGRRLEVLPSALQFPVRPLAGTPRPEGLLPAPGAEWLILHRIGPAGEPAAALADRHGTVYQLEETLPYAGLSGWHWFLYRKQGRPASAPAPG
jgi:hypothetical protein